MLLKVARADLRDEITDCRMQSHLMEHARPTPPERLQPRLVHDATGSRALSVGLHIQQSLSAKGKKFEIQKANVNYVSEFRVHLEINGRSRKS